MRLIRFFDSTNSVKQGSLRPDGSALLIDGDILGNYTVTHQAVAVKRVLAPIVPPAIICIGLNYRKHAEETGAKIPEFPVVFFKNPAAVRPIRMGSGMITSSSESFTPPCAIMAEMERIRC